MAVIWVPILILIVVLVVDVGNWFTHRRHLQTQADAAALAAAGDFTIPCNDAAIEQTARFYSGDEAAGFNQQLGGTPPDETHMELNSDTWYAQDTPVDDTAPDGTPCATKVIDVKMTETDLPLFLHVAGLFSSVDFINTQARVEIRRRERFSGRVAGGSPRHQSHGRPGDVHRRGDRGGARQPRDHPQGLAERPRHLGQLLRTLPADGRPRPDRRPGGVRRRDVHDLRPARWWSATTPAPRTGSCWRAAIPWPAPAPSRTLLWRATSTSHPAPARTPTSTTTAPPARSASTPRSTSGPAASSRRSAPR